MVANNLWLSETNEHLIQVWSVRESRLVHQWGPYYGAIEVLGRLMEIGSRSMVSVVGSLT